MSKKNESKKLVDNENKNYKILESEIPVEEFNILSYEGAKSVLQDDIQSAWKITKGAGVKIAVIDGKVDVTHPDFGLHITDGFDIKSNSELTYNIDLNDEYQHGTHVTGIIASTVPEAEIIPIAVFEGRDAGVEEIIKAIDYAQEQGADIVNCSWCSDINDKELKEKIADSGMLFVCAVGNNNNNVDQHPVYPACFDIDNVISVASIDYDLKFSSYSDYGTSIDIAMYGHDVTSTIPNGMYGKKSGASMAAAYVTAGAAMIKAVNRTANVKDVLLSTSATLSNLTDKVRNGKKLSYRNLISGILNDAAADSSCKDNLNTGKCESSSDKNLELYSIEETPNQSTDEE